MLTPDFVATMKQVNISKDAEKTKQRLKSVWMSIDKAKREEILNLAGIKRVTVERSYRLGCISVKLAAAIAQVLSTDPYYLTGETDKQRKYNESLLIQFLNDNGYPYEPVASKEATEQERPDKLDKPAVDEAKEIEQMDTVSIVSSGLQDIIELIKNKKSDLENLSEEETIILLNGLFIRAKYNKQAGPLLEFIKLALLV